VTKKANTFGCVGKNGKEEECLHFSDFGRISSPNWF